MAPTLFPSVDESLSHRQKFVSYILQRYEETLKEILKYVCVCVFNVPWLILPVSWSRHRVLHLFVLSTIPMTFNECRHLKRSRHYRVGRLETRTRSNRELRPQAHLPGKEFTWDPTAPHGTPRDPTAPHGTPRDPTAPHLLH